MAPTTEKPIFHIVLSDRDVREVEVEWPDGTLERVDAFISHFGATHWVTTQSKRWLEVRSIFCDKALKATARPNQWAKHMVDLATGAVQKPRPPQEATILDILLQCREGQNCHKPNIHPVIDGRLLMDATRHYS